MSRICLVGRWLLGVGSVMSAARAADPVTIENVAGRGWAAAYKVGAWTPVVVDVQGGPRRFAGTLELEAPDEDGSPTFVRLPLTVGAGQMIATTAYVRPGTSNGEDLVVRVRDERGRRAAREVRAEVPGGRPVTRPGTPSRP